MYQDIDTTLSQLSVKNQFSIIILEREKCQEEKILSGYVIVLFAYSFGIHAVVQGFILNCSDCIK